MRSEEKDKKQTELEEYDIKAVNRNTGHVLTDKDEVLAIVGWHNVDDDNVEPEDATFVTFQFPNGNWGYATLSDFPSTAQN